MAAGLTCSTGRSSHSSFPWKIHLFPCIPWCVGSLCWGRGTGQWVLFLLFAVHPAQLSDAVHAGGAEEGLLRHVPSPSSPFIYYLTLCFVRKGCYFMLGLLFIPLSCAHACRGLWSPLEELHGQPVLESLGWAWQWGLQKGFVQGGGLGIHLKTGFCVSFPRE